MGPYFLREEKGIPYESVGSGVEGEEDPGDAQEGESDVEEDE